MKNALLILAALIALPAFAAAAPPKPAPKPASPPPSTTANDEEEEEAPKPKPAAPETKETAPALGAVTTSPADEKQQKLVSGAPLYNPNVAVHIVEQKEYSDKWSREV